MVAQKESGWAIKKRLDLDAPVIAQRIEAKVQNEVELADVYHTTPSAISRAVERYREKKGAKHEQQSITPSISFLHQDSQSCWHSWVHAVADVISGLKTHALELQNDMEETKERYERRIAELEAQLAKRNAPDEEALMLLLEHIRR